MHNAQWQVVSLLGGKRTIYPLSLLYEAVREEVIASIVQLWMHF